MGSVTKKIIIDDIILRVTEARPTDDFTVPREQIGYILDTVRDEVVAKEVHNNLRQGRIVNSIYIEKEASKLIVSENDGSTGCAIRHYVTIDKDPVWVVDDMAIVLVQTSDGTRARRMNQKDIETSRFLSGSKPSPTNPVWHREGRNIYLDEFTDIQANEVTIHVHYVPTAGYITDETAVYPLDDSDRAVVTEIVVDEIIKELGGTIDDIIEDGDIDNN